MNFSEQKTAEAIQVIRLAQEAADFTGCTQLVYANTLGLRFRDYDDTRLALTETAIELVKPSQASSLLRFNRRADHANQRTA